MHGVQAQNYHIMTPAVGKDWALAWGCNAYVKELPYANAAYHYNFKPGESGKLTLEFWITPFDYAGCEGPRRAVESVLSENKLIGLAWAILDYDDANSEKHAFWNLSRQHTMALPFSVLDQELDLALERRFGRPQHPRQRQVFGVGMRHITEGRLDWPELDLSALPDGGASVPVGLRAQLKSALAEFIEEGLLRQGPDTFDAVGFDQVASDHGQKFVDFENLVAEEIAKHGLTGEAIDQAVRGTDFGDIRPAVVEALGRIGMTHDEFMQRITPGELMSFMDDLPTRYVTNVMRSAKHRQTQQQWEPNDFIDILALPVAAVYCEVVITEKQWVHRLRQGKVAQRYNTILLNDVADLVDVLVRASAS